MAFALGRIAISAIPALGRAALPALGRAASGVSKLYGGKAVGSIVGQKLFEYGLLLPVAGAAANALGVPFGAPKPAAPAPAAGAGGGGLTPQQFDRLYGTNNWQVGPFQLPFGGNQGYLEQQANQQRQLQRDLAGYQLDATRIGAGTQRYGFDTQKSIADMGYRTQQEVARMGNETQRMLGFANLATGYATTDLTSRRQLQGLYGGFQRDVAIADRNLALGYDTNRTQSRIASMQTNLGRYQADRAVENTRLTQIAPRLAAIGSVYNRRY